MAYSNPRMDAGTSSAVEGQEENSHGSYMRAKRRKLGEQFEDDRRTIGRSRLLEGVRVYVNGYTDPPASTIKRLVCEHGGTFQTNDDALVTHTIAEQLAVTKMNKLTRGKLVVTPQWLVNSIDAGRRLPPDEYVLYPQTASGTLTPSTHPRAPSPLPNREPSTSHQRELRTCSDGFIASFYARSRLHHISRWAVRLRTVVHDLRQGTHDLPARRLLQPDDSSSWRNAWHSHRIIIHIDMDCFFVSVALRQHAHLVGHPVAIAHGGRQGEGSMSEIASCSYEARALGVKAGMLIGRAHTLCPDLRVLPYEFDAYDRVSRQLYSIVAEYTLEMHAVSCDELYADVSDVCTSCDVSPSTLVCVMRARVQRETGCAASVGVGENLLVARLATRRAKPDGQHVVTPECTLANLPGVGRQTMDKLAEMVTMETTCEEVLDMADATRDRLGVKTADALLANCRGRTDKTIEVSRPVKSVSCDINYAVRLANDGETFAFLGNIARELECRLLEAKRRGRHIALKLMIRAPHAPREPAKYMGHGECHVMSRSETLPQSTHDATRLTASLRRMCSSLAPLAIDVRGVGVTITRLESTDDSSTKVGGMADWLRPPDATPFEATITPRPVYVAPLPVAVHGHCGMPDIKAYMENMVTRDLVLSEDMFESMCVSLVEGTRDEATLADVLIVVRQLARHWKTYYTHIRDAVVAAIREKYHVVICDLPLL